MGDTRSKKPTAYLRTGQHELQIVFAKIKELEILGNKILPNLDATLRPYCVVANCVGKTVTLIVANGSIATQIRFSAPDIIRKLHADPALKHIQHIQCKVRPNSPNSPKTNEENKIEMLSPETADIVREIAGSLEDEKLREIMQRIASHVKTRK